MNTNEILAKTWRDECAPGTNPAVVEAATDELLALIATWLRFFQTDPAVTLGNLARVLELASEAIEDNQNEGM
jgi:hypothetical protein